MSEWVSYEEYKKIKKEYVKGTRVELDFMDDEMSPPKGTRGTVYMVDDEGIIRMDWDDGSSLALIPNVDKFHIINEDNDDILLYSEVFKDG